MGMTPPRDLLALAEAWVAAVSALLKAELVPEIGDDKHAARKAAIAAKARFVEALAHAGGDERSVGIETALRLIHDTFKRDLDQGYSTRDKQFAVDVAAQALTAARATPGERSEAVGHSISDSVKAVAARRFACKARSGSVGGHDVQDCDYPHCACGPTREAAHDAERVERVADTNAEEEDMSKRDRLRLAVTMLMDTPSLHDYPMPLIAARLEGLLAENGLTVVSDQPDAIEHKIIEIEEMAALIVPCRTKDALTWLIDELRRTRAALAAIAPEVRG